MLSSTPAAEDRPSCIILAGGKGQRMAGSDKGLRRYRDRRLIEHVIARVSPQVDDIIISANRNLEKYHSLGFTVVQDNTDICNGPLAGIQSAMPHCRNPWVLVIPCDMPALPGDLVTTLQQHIGESSLIAVRCNDKIQLVFLMHKRLLDSINNFLDGRQHTVMRWVDTVEPNFVDIDHEDFWHNINTFEQLRN